MEDGYNDDYPMLDFELPIAQDECGIYAEDQVVIGPDGPELAPIEAPWDDGSADDNFDDYEPYSEPQEEEFYAIDPRELSCCHEEWEDYC